jgi:hypothetical protein
MHRAVARGYLRVAGEGELPRRDSLRNKCVKARFKERDSPLLERFNSLWVWVNGKYVMADLCKACSSHKANVPCTVDGDLH